MSIDFIFIGPSKTASTWIYKALDEHPEFSLPKSKDIYYFDQFYDKGLGWYDEQFQSCKLSKIVGEFSHDYILSEPALNRIREYNSNIKIIICLRNPYERTESGVKFLQRNGYGFGELKDLIVKHDELINGSLYGKNLELVYSIFPKENVLLLDYSKLQENPDLFLLDIYDFFDVEDHKPSILNKKVNKAKSARLKMLSLLMKKTALLIRRCGGGSIVGYLKMNPLVNKLLFKEEDGSFRLNNNDRELLSNFFTEDIKKLEMISGRNFDEWK